MIDYKPDWLDKTIEKVDICTECSSCEAAFGDEFCAECRKQADDELAQCSD